MKKIVFIIGLLAVTVVAKSQSYGTSAGIRLGSENGFTIKHFLGESSALEGIVSSHWRNRGLTITGLYEIVNPISSVEGLNWFIGGGAHVGFYSGYSDYGRYKNRYDADYYDGSSTTAIGLDGIIGLEFVIPNAPLSISLDWKPSFNLIGGYDRFYGDGGALSFRYIF